MSVLISGLLGVAINIIPSLFKIFAADRQEGDVREAAIEIIKNLAGTDDPAQAQTKIETDPKIEAALNKALAQLASDALEEQERAEEHQKQMDEKFLLLRKAEREQQHQHELEVMEADLQNAEAARAHAREMAKSESLLAAGINPILSFLIAGGFIVALYGILRVSEPIENPEIFYTAMGTLATAFATIIAFHFGSSSGSKQKDGLIVAAPQDADEAGAGGDRAGGFSGGSAIVAARTEADVRPPPDTDGTFTLFRQKAPGIMQDLMDDFGLTLDQAAGVLGNLGHECAGFKILQEIHPSVRGSKGGWGWAQWTGPRRRALKMVQGRRHQRPFFG